MGTGPTQPVPAEVRTLKQLRNLCTAWCHWDVDGRKGWFCRRKRLTGQKVDGVYVPTRGRPWGKRRHQRAVGTAHAREAGHRAVGSQPPSAQTRHRSSWDMTLKRRSGLGQCTYPWWPARTKDPRAQRHFPGISFPVRPADRFRQPGEELTR